ncbi:sensor protein SphS [Desulfosporosinus acididurans]|uniref:histidine kinase n=1 Tax=Desulfosporosinus acididurans TaxID=476652 RepID=A0A0J1FMB7_9FIRM|nr:HAMP domain-containing sensor histidine kinase [Desulfosporosinus acididurans]KLU64098.1 sensor protein SphS [Desulfosporosinus acididurans]
MALRNNEHRRQPQKLRRLFTGYLAVFCLGTILFVVSLFAIFDLLLTNSVILPANYGEVQLSVMKEKIASSNTVTPDMIPETCSYGVFTRQGRFVSGNFNKKDAAMAWDLTQKQGRDRDFIYYYLPIPRRNEICIVRYTLLAQFSSPVLRQFLPSPEILFELVLGLGFLLEVFLLASSFGRKLTKKLHSLEKATEKIQNHDLNFSVESSGIYEIDNVLYSIDKMKEALKESLQKQWDQEQTRREQISALAHDIKTPITIIRGNVDLLSETNQTEEQKSYTGYIIDSARQMEQYVRTLIEISKAEMGFSLHKEILDTGTFITKIHKQISALMAVKRLSLDFKTRNLPQSLHADSDLLQRAILNIAANAVDFSPQGGTIVFDVGFAGDTVQFCVVDSGNGFSEDALKNATQQFYMGDKSRSSKAHYGMGLFIANSIAVQHKGRLLAENSSETGGGMVTIRIPIESGEGKLK